MDNPEQQMIKKSFLLALGRYHMLFATEQQNFLSSYVLLRLILQCACISPHAPADSSGSKTEECRSKLSGRGSQGEGEEEHSLKY